MSGITIWPTEAQAVTAAGQHGQAVKVCHHWRAIPHGATVPAAWQTSVRATDPPTSHQAARTANRGDGQKLCLAALYRCPAGLTDFELADRTGIKQTSIGVRRGELRKAGLVTDTGRTRPSDTGSPATVWALTPAGTNAARSAA